MALLYKADPERGVEWRRILAARAPDLVFRLWPETGDPAIFLASSPLTSATRATA